MSLIRKIIYGKPSGIILKKFLSLFYKEEYLNGKYFDEKRMGFWWCIRSLPHIISMHRQEVYWPVNPQCNILGGAILNLIIVH